MRKLDLFWRSNRDWWEFRNHIPTLKDDAPPEAQKSYRRYLEQTAMDEAEHYKNILMESIENIVEAADELRAKNGLNEVEYGQLIAYAECLCIIRDACDRDELETFGLSFDIDRKYLVRDPRHDGEWDPPYSINPTPSDAEREAARKLEIKYLKQYDRVQLKNGLYASIVEIFEKEKPVMVKEKAFLADIDKDGDTYTEDITVDDIQRVLKFYEDV